MSGLPLFDAAGRRRSPATLPGYHAGREPRNQGRTYPADPPTVDEIVELELGGRLSRGRTTAPLSPSHRGAW